MRAVITVIGKDNVGILTKVSAVCTKYNANVIEVTQSVLQDMFAMIMLVDISSLNKDFSVLADENPELAVKYGIKRVPTLLVPTANGIDKYIGPSEVKRYIESVK